MVNAVLEMSLACVMLIKGVPVRKRGEQRILQDKQYKTFSCASCIYFETLLILHSTLSKNKSSCVIFFQIYHIYKWQSRIKHIHIDI